MSQRPKKTSSQRYRARDAGPRPGKYAQDASRLIGYAILLLALLLVVIGSMLA
jgi:hypothetical protein